MKKLNRVLHEAIDREEIHRAARAQRVLRNWSEIVGPGLASKSIPDRYVRGTVWVAVAGSSWAQELRLMKDVILSRLRDLSREPDLFQTIRFGVRTAIPALEIEEEKPVSEHRSEIEGLSIQEIAARRLKKMRDAEHD